MPTINLPQFDLYYEFSGRSDGPMLLFSNSLGTTLSLWEPQLCAFEKEFHILRYDMRGHGASSMPTGPYTIALLGQDVLALLDELHLRSVYFCGISIGGVIGQWLGVNAPDRIRRLILCNTAAKIGTDMSWNQRIEQVNTAGVASIADAVLARWFTPCFFREHPQTIAAMRDMLLQVQTSGYTSTCAAVRDMDLHNSIGQIHAPVLILAGEHDPVTTVEDSLWLQQHISGSKLVTLAAAHISNVEAAADFNAAVLDFLR
jgi:3-oxoadipate enol-lactonase